MEKMREGIDSHGRRRKMREGPPSPAAAELATRAGMWEGGDGGKPTGSKAHGRWQGIGHGTHIYAKTTSFLGQTLSARTTSFMGQRE
jgi:hypothetical protein